MADVLPLFFEGESYHAASSGVEYESCSDTGGGLNVAGWGIGGWVRYDGVWFDASTTQIQVRVATQSSGNPTLSVREGSNTGTLLGSTTVASTGGWQAWTTLTIDLSETLTGKHDVCFVLSGSGGNYVNLNWWRLRQPGDTRDDIRADTSQPDGAVRVQAESWSSHTGLGTEDCSDTGGGSNLSDAAAGDSAVYNSVALTADLTELRLRVAWNSWSMCAIEVRAGGTSGTLLATVRPPYTAGWQTWRTHPVRIAGQSGSTNIALVFTGSGIGPNVNWLQFQRPTAVDAPDATGSLTFSGSASAEAGGGGSAASASGSLTLSGSSTARSAATATGAMSIGGSVTGRGVATAGGALSLSGSASASGRAAASGSLSISGAASARGAASATGALSIGGSASARGAAAASGSLSVGGSASGRGAATATGALSLSGSASAADGSVAAAASGALSIAGAASARGSTSAAGALTIGGSVSVGGGMAATAVGSLSISGSATARAAASAVGALILSGASGGSAAPVASGALGLSGSAAVAAPAIAAGALDFGGLAAMSAAATASGSLILSGLVADTGEIVGYLTLSGSARAKNAMSGRMSGTVTTGPMSGSHTTSGQMSGTVTATTMEGAHS